METSLSFYASQMHDFIIGESHIWKNFDFFLKGEGINLGLSIDFSFP